MARLLHCIVLSLIFFILDTSNCQQEEGTAVATDVIQDNLPISGREDIFPHVFLVPSHKVHTDTTSATEPIRGIIQSEMSKLMGSVSDSLSYQLSEMKEEVGDNLYSILSLFEEVPGDVGHSIQDKKWTKLGKILDFSPRTIQVLTERISSNLEEKINRQIEKNVSERLGTLINNLTSYLNTSLNNIEENYSRMYKKLYVYTREQFILSMARLNITEEPVGMGRQDSPTTTPTPIVYEDPPRDCAEAKDRGLPSGVTTIRVHPMIAPQDVMCAEGWTVVLRRMPVEPFDQHVDFRRSFDEYERGFGDPDTEYWMGLNALHFLTTSYGNYEIQVDVAATGETATSSWKTFSVGSSTGYKGGYRLQVAGYNKSSTAGDALSYHNGMEFSTIDSDNDDSSGGSCSSWSGGGGWWYNYCYYSNPTALYPPLDLHQNAEVDHLVEWRKWQGYYKYLSHFSMKVRPFIPV